MARVHELVFKIQGTLDNKFGATFDRASGSVDKMARRLNNLEKQKISVEKYQKLTQNIESTKSAIEKATSRMTPLQKEFKASEKATNQLGEELKSAETKVYDLSMEIAKSTKPTSEMRSALSVAKLEASKLKKEFGESERQTKTLGNEFRAAEREVTTLKGSLDSQERSLQDLADSFGFAGKSADDFKRYLLNVKKEIVNTERVMKNLKRVQESYSKVQENWSKTKQRTGDFFKTGAAVGASLAIPLKFAVDSEEVMADVNKMVDFESLQEMKDFEKAMRDRIGFDLPLKFEEYGELIANAAGAGVGQGMEGMEKYQELLNFGGDSAKMAVAFDIDGGEAGEMMAKWRAGFAMNQEEVVELADKINYLGDNSAAKAKEISSMVSEIGALGGVAGISTGEVAAISAAMVSMGVGPEVGATAIKKMSTQLTKGGQASKQAQKFYQKMGTTSAQVAQDMQKDAQGTVLKVLKGIGELDKVEQTSALREIFGEVSIGAVAPLLQNLDQLQNYFDMMDESAKLYGGSMEREFGIRSETTANKIQILRNNMESIVTTVGEALLPNLVELTTKANEAAQKFREWAAENPEQIEKFIKTAAAIGGIIVAGKGILAIISLFKTFGSVAGLAFNVVRLGGSVAFPLLGAAGKVVAGVFMKGIIPAVKVLWGLFMASPLVIKIALIVAAVKLLYDNWDKITGFFESTIEKIKGFFTGLGEKIGGVVDVVSGFGSVVKGLADGISSFFRGTDRELTNAENRYNGSSLHNYSTASSSNTAGIAMRAKGGIITRPELAMIGEGGAHEAVIPLDGTANAMRLWQYAGERLGMVKSGVNQGSQPLVGRVNDASGGNSYNDKTFIIEMPMEVIVNGDGTNATNIIAALEEALMTASPRLRAIIINLLDEIDTDNRRLAYT